MAKSASDRIQNDRRNIAYVALNTFANPAVIEQFDKHFENFKSAKALILDVRYNGGGSSGIAYAVIARLITEKTKLTSSWRSPKYIAMFHTGLSDDKWLEGGGYQIEPRGSEQFQGTVVLLTGPGRYSAAEDFLVPLRALKRAKFVGQTTGGSTGNPMIFDIHGAQCAVVTQWDFFPDGTEFVGIGIKPDTEIGPTRQDVFSETDRVLQAAVAEIKEELRTKDSK